MKHSLAKQPGLKREKRGVIPDVGGAVVLELFFQSFRAVVAIQNRLTTEKLYISITTSRKITKT